MKKRTKILTVIIMIVLAVCMCTNVLATTTSVPSESVDPDSYKPKDLTVTDAGEFVNIANSIIAAIRIFGTVVAVVALMALGVKYMLGSVQDRAGYKETMIPYLVGAVMVFAIPNVIGIIFDLVTQIKFENTI